MGLRRRAEETFKRVQEKVGGMSVIRSASKASISTVLKERGLELIYLTVFFTFAAGVVNSLLEGTNPMVRNFIIYPGRGLQTPPETLVYFFSMILGTVGIYLIYLGGRQTVRKRISDFYLLLGFTALLVAVTLSLYVFDVKAGI